MYTSCKSYDMRMVRDEGVRVLYIVDFGIIIQNIVLFVHILFTISSKLIHIYVLGNVRQFRNHYLLMPLLRYNMLNCVHNSKIQQHAQW